MISVICNPILFATLRVARIALREPLPSSLLGDVRLVSSFVLRSAARDPRIVPRSRKVKPLMAR